VPNPDGSKGKPDHQATVQQLEREAAQEFPAPRYEIQSNRPLPRGEVNRRPDVAVIDAKTGRVVQIYEAVRTNKDGVTPVSRERKKVQEYDAAGIPSVLVPVRPLPPRLEQR
jgi:hypothetical protein